MFGPWFCILFLGHLLSCCCVLCLYCASGVLVVFRFVFVACRLVCCLRCGGCVCVVVCYFAFAFVGCLRLCLWLVGSIKNDCILDTEIFASGACSIAFAKFLPKLTFNI